MLKGGQMDWEAAARHFHRAGLRDDRGMPLDGAKAEVTWRRVLASKDPHAGA
ncbi:hypothetical protein [Falsiroseomonas sp. HW251]|uniref:hypothetical protein n=1 Tax=Falsiroseomonas sp. HW251 TaxID=3390998 RepID=UPI003D322F00